MSEGGPGGDRREGGPGGDRREGGPRGDRRERGPRRPGERDGRRRDDDRRGGRGGPRGRDRDSARRPERKLYNTDSVVDRGFEDVEEEGAETRRVHWTIVKRTVADLISRKAVSATYVLQRDGQESEFPTLGHARTAVNKTIVHPEKLTRSKAEYAAEKK